MRKTINILGIKFNNFNIQELLRLIEKNIDNDDKFRVAFSNPEFIMESLKNPFMKDYLNTCLYNLPDGTGVLLAAKILHNKVIKERITGTDFVPEICRLAAEKKYGIYFLGSKEGIADLAANRLREVYPNLQIVGTHHGYFENSDQIINLINKSNPHILMVCMGNPYQEQWIDKNYDKINANLIFGNGGALDFWSGEKSRAPNIIIRWNLEWFYRLLTDFSLTRFKRQLRLLIFIYYVFKKKVLH